MFPFFWYAGAMAAGVSLGEPLLEFGWKDWIAAFVLSFSAGLYGLLGRISRSYKYKALLAEGKQPDPEDYQPISWHVFAFDYIYSALFAGFVGFLVGKWQFTDVYGVLFTVLTFALGGSKIIDLFSSGFRDWVISLVTKKR
jgi:hypothetical protein